MRSEKAVYAAAVLAALLACKKGGSSSEGATETSDQTPVVVKAEELHKDYQANEVAADLKYKDKKLRVGGLIHSIDKDAFDNIVLRLATGNQFASAMATMQDSEKTAVASLSKNQAIVVECRGGGMVIGSPVLKDCKIHSSGKSKP